MTKLTPLDPETLKAIMTARQEGRSRIYLMSYRDFLNHVIPLLPFHKDQVAYFRQDDFLQCLAFHVHAPGFPVVEPFEEIPKEFVTLPDTPINNDLFRACNDAIESLSRLPDVAGAYRTECLRQCRDAVANAKKLLGDQRPDGVRWPDTPEYSDNQQG